MRQRLVFLTILFSATCGISSGASLAQGLTDSPVRYTGNRLVPF